jgi:hypothetical protein
MQLQGFNSLTIPGAWTLWTRRNRCVFEGVTPDMARALTLVSEERKLWSMAGARGISFLTAPTLCRLERKKDFFGSFIFLCVGVCWVELSCVCVLSGNVSLFSFLI